MSKPVCEKEEEPFDMDIDPSLMVIPTYAELQKERSLKREKVKARFYDANAPSALRVHTKCIQTSLDCFDNKNEIQLRAELASKDEVICVLKEKISQTKKLNERLNRQLIKSSFSHSEKEDVMGNLTSELENLKKELKIKENLLVDLEGYKERESEMVAKLAKQHMVILRLSHDLNLIRKRMLDLNKIAPKSQYLSQVIRTVYGQPNPKDDEPAVPRDGVGER